MTVGDPAFLPRNLGRRSVHGATVTFAAQIARFGAQFASQAILAHLLLPAEFGLIAMVSPVISLVLMLNQLGLTEATIQRKEITQGELSALFWVNVAASAALAALLIAAAPLVAWFYDQPATMPITMSLAVLVLLSGLSAQQMALLNRHMRFVSIAAIEVSATVAAALVGIGAALAGLGVWSLVAMQAANAGVVAVFAWLFCQWAPSWPRRQPAIRSLLHFGGNVTGSNILGYLSYSLDNVLIGATNPSAALGYYDRAFKLMFQPLVQAIAPFERVAVPLLSRQQDQPAAYVRSYVRLQQVTSLAIIPGIIAAIVTADRVVPLLLGRQWQPAAPLFAWLAVACLGTPFAMSTNWLFISQDRTRELLRWGALASGARILSFVIGLPWGPLGVAIASAAASCLVQAPLLGWGATRRGPVRLRTLIAEGYPFVLGGLGALAALELVQADLADAGVPGLLLMVAVSYAAYTLVLACLPQGMRVLKDIWRTRSAFGRASA